MNFKVRCFLLLVVFLYILVLYVFFLNFGLLLFKFYKLYSMVFRNLRILILFGIFIFLMILMYYIC